MNKPTEASVLMAVAMGGVTDVNPPGRGPRFMVGDVDVTAIMHKLCRKGAVGWRGRRFPDRFQAVPYICDTAGHDEGWTIGQTV
jgi:hypothetical protein